MFHRIPQTVSERMRYLEALDAEDRINGTPPLKRLRQIPSETGHFLALLAAAAEYLGKYKHVSFCFLDAEKEVYRGCYDMVIPNMVRGGILVADNAINHEATLRPMLDAALSDERVDALIVPIGKGELVCRKL